MASITSTTSLGTGLDINALVSQIVAAEGAPVAARLDRREGELQARLSAFGTLKSALSSFQTSLASLKSFDTFNTKSVSSSDSDILTANTSSNVTSGNYDINITQRAKSQQLSTDPTGVTEHRFTNISDIVGTGTLTFKFGTTTTGPYGFTQDPDKATKTVEITDGSLKGIRDAINDADIGVSASVVFDGTYQRLVFTTQTGANNSIQISVDDDDANDTDASGLSLLAYNASVQTLAQNGAAQDAIFSLNGVTINSELNKVTSAIDGLTINLLADTGSATLTVQEDLANVNTNVSNFVSKYNALINIINDLSKYNPETKQAGLLNGDGVLRSISSQIRRALSNPVDGLTGSVTILADIGITTSSSDGSLVLDNDKLTAALENNLQDVVNLFSTTGNTSDSFIDFVSSTDQTLVDNYAVNITTIATHGSLAGSAAANLTISAGSNDEITLSIDGKSATITLTPGVYASAAALAAEVQARINGAEVFSDAGITVGVSESTGVLSITSNSYGSTSTVNVSGGNGRDDLVGSSPTSSVGQNVAGTIGEYEATGEGQYLTGTNAATGLRIKVEGNTVGDRGTVSFTRGYAQQLGDILDALLDSEGIFTNLTDGINAQIKGVTEDRAALERRLTKIEERTRSQFIALDGLVATLRASSDFLTQQLASLPKIEVRNRNN